MQGPPGAWRVEMQIQRISQTLGSKGISSAELVWMGDPYILSHFSLSEWECLAYACHTVLFWKQIISFSGLREPQI